MDIFLQFGAGAAQKISYDFLGFLILLPIAIIIDLIIRAVRKNNSEKAQSKTATQKSAPKSDNKKQTIEEKEYIEKSNKRTKTILLILFWLYAVPVICLVTASLATVIFRTADVAPPTAIITLVVIVAILLYNKRNKSDG